MEGKPYKRRIMIVDPEFQYRFICRTAALAVLIVAASLSLLAITFYLNLDLQTVIIQPLPLIISENAAVTGEPKTILSILLTVLLISVAITLAVTFFFGIVVSHRMAGPLFRIRKELKEVEEGNLSGDVRLRGKDDFKSLAQAVNGLKGTWRNRVQELKGIVSDLHSDKTAEHASALNRLKEIVSSFKID